VHRTAQHNAHYSENITVIKTMHTNYHGKNYTTS